MRPNKRCRLTPGDRARVKKLLLSGMPRKEVAANCGVSIDTVNLIYHQPENFVHTARISRIEGETEKQMVQMLQNGESSAKISLALGISCKRVREVRKKHKIPVPKAFSNHRLTEQQKQDIKRQLESGKHTITHIAKVCNVGVATVTKLRREFKIPGPPCSRRLSESTREEIIKLLLAGAQSSTVLKQFGICAATLHEIRKQNNIPVTGPGRPISDALGQTITRLLERGKTISEVATITGVMTETVARRRRWRFGDRPSQLYPPEKVERIKRLIAQGLYPRTVAEMVGISDSSIYGFIKAHNLKANYMAPRASRKHGPRRNTYKKNLAAQATTHAANAQNSCSGIKFLEEIPFVVLI
ncbi:hypothetical protein BC940DRAFT_292236 [Gongronella butleri]|nr:hypothetical protein BC940DRAFT_292236 [Gongronella butleri]